MNQKRYVVLDRDGTVNIEREYLSDPDQFELLPGAASGLRHMKKLGLGLVIITNQSAISRGYFDWTRLNLIHQKMCELLAAENIHLDGIYVCPHHPDDKCTCRKPQPGLLKQGSLEHNFEPREAFIIGDKLSDIELGKQVGATTLLVQTGYGTEVAKKNKAIWDYIVSDLAEAALVIENLLNSSNGRSSDGI